MNIAIRDFDDPTGPEMVLKNHFQLDYSQMRGPDDTLYYRFVHFWDTFVENMQLLGRHLEVGEQFRNEYPLYVWPDGPV